MYAEVQKMLQIQFTIEEQSSSRIFMIYTLHQG